MPTVTHSQWSAGSREPDPRSDALARIERHALASEILRVRSATLAFSAFWFLGLGFDLIVYARLGGGPLWLILTARLGSTAFLVAIGWHLYSFALETPRLTRTLVVLCFVIIAIAQSILAAALGGLSSPELPGMFIALIAQGIALTMPWRRALALSLPTALAYPTIMLIGCARSSELAAQLADARIRDSFVLEMSLLVGAAVAAAAGSHAAWSLRRNLIESKSVGRYRLISRLGRGGMGEVWRATDRTSGRDVALKIMLPRFEDTDPRLVRAAVDRFEREIEATVRLDHPHVVRVLDWGATDDGIWYYAMELLTGGDLASIVEARGVLAPELVIRLGIQAGRALGTAHRAGIVHRDVKPANLFVVERDGRIELKVLDFGVARVDRDAGLTRTGAVVGTPSFMAPEVASGTPADPRSDVWALAASLRYALIARRPHDPRVDTDPAIPAALAPILDAALAVDPSARPTDGTAFADELARIA